MRQNAHTFTAIESDDVYTCMCVCCVLTGRTDRGEPAQRQHGPAVGGDVAAVVRRRGGTDLHVGAGDGRHDDGAAVRALHALQRHHHIPNILLLEQQQQLRSQEDNGDVDDGQATETEEAQLGRGRR